ncbi:MAG: VOC family protein [Chitinophagaceae bacterium]
MQRFTPYLHFPGNAADAMNFYRSVLGGDFTIYQQFKNVPGSEKMSAEDQEKFIHISLLTPGGHSIMATDTPASMEQVVPGNNFHICIHATDESEADTLFDSLSAGGRIEMPMNKTFWGAYFGMCVDRFGTRWMINYSSPTQ